MKKNIVIILKMKLKKEILNQQNFYLYGICWVLDLGFGSTILGKKAAMLCTASVEEVIDEHYLNQINQLRK
jgi:ubiquinone biosynthesis monooxygenase Coq7